MTTAADFNQFVDTLQALKNVGGNCHFEWRLLKAIQRAGKHIGEMTIDEFLAIHNQVSAEYNEIDAHIKGGR